MARYDVTMGETLVCGIELPAFWTINGIARRCVGSKPLTKRMPSPALASAMRAQPAGVLGPVDLPPMQAATRQWDWRAEFLHLRRMDDRPGCLDDEVLTQRAKRSRRQFSRFVNGIDICGHLSTILLLSFFDFAISSGMASLPAPAQPRRGPKR